jgi:phosphohistidine phosphatase SixA
MNPRQYRSLSPGRLIPSFGTVEAGAGGSVPRTPRPRLRWACGLALAAGLLAAPAVAAAQAPAVIYLVRHAETAPDGSDDPPLSAEGMARARRLGAMLGHAGLTHIHTTDLARTRTTARAVSEATGIPVETYDPGRLEAFAERLRSGSGVHLVVGHSNTTPALVRLLGGAPGGAIAEDEYGRVYQLTLLPDEVRTAVLGYPGGLLSSPPPATPAVEARPEDVASVEALLAALYDVISGPAGERRDWDRLRSLFLPTARMVPVQRSPDGDVGYRALTVEEYIQASGPTLERIGFTERELARIVEQFGDVAHVFSTYEGHREGTPEPLVRGLNSIQMIHDGDRWWVSSLAWSPERPDLPIPPRYRP